MDLWGLLTVDMVPVNMVPVNMLPVNMLPCCPSTLVPVNIGACQHWCPASLSMQRRAEGLGPTKSLGFAC